MNYNYDNDLNELVFFKMHPDYLPFIGDAFDKYRILIVGESHYIPQEPNNAKYHLDYFQKNRWDGNCLELYDIIS